MQSPTAMSLGKFGDIPVGLYRGAPDIVFPLYEVKARTHSLPIRLRYHASGVRVGEPASWVGQNWALEAGGVITRTMRGRPDEQANGFLSTRAEMAAFLDMHGGRVIGKQFSGGHGYAYDHDDWTYLHGISIAKEDAEPDQFFFNVAGMAGQFFFNNDPSADEQIVMTTRGRPVKIEYEGSQWTLWGPDGTRYVFAQPEMTSVLAAGRIGIQYVSSWYLTAVYPPSSEGDAIRLYYEEADNWVTYVSGGAEVWKDPIITDGYHQRCPGTRSQSYATIDRTYKPQYLSYIVSDRVRVDFVSEAGRDDILRERRLKEIQVMSGTERLKSFVFDHGYFNEGTRAARLRLDALRVVGASGASGGTYEFTYDTSPALPAYTSTAIDHWGFYNGARSGLIPTVEHNGETYRGNTSRKPRAGYVKAGILQKITYPTGGHTRFIYEMHDYGDINGEADGSGRAGELRIQRIESDPGGDAPPVIKRYEYTLPDGTSSGVLVAKPAYYRVQNFKDCTDAYYAPQQIVDCRHLYRSSSSLVALGTASGGHIGYRRVMVYYAQAGATQNRAVHTFDAEGSRSDRGGPRVPRPNVQWNHGQKSFSRYYNAAGQLVRTIDYDYNTSSTDTYPEVYGLRVNQAGEGILPDDPDNLDGEYYCVTNYMAHKYAVQV